MIMKFYNDSFMHSVMNILQTVYQRFIYREKGYEDTYNKGNLRDSVKTPELSRDLESKNF